MKTTFFILTFSMCYFSCKNPDFYADTTLMFEYRLPLIEPYQILTIKPGTVWGLRGPIVQPIKAIEYFEWCTDSIFLVCDSLIFMRGKESESFEQQSLGFFVVLVNSRSIRKYQTLELMKSAFPNVNIKFQLADDVYNKFVKNPNKITITSLLCEQ